MALWYTSSEHDRIAMLNKSDTILVTPWSGYDTPVKQFMHARAYLLPCVYFLVVFIYKDGTQGGHAILMITFKALYCPAYMVSCVSANE